MAIASNESVASIFKETLVKGQPARLECIEIAGHTFEIHRGFLTTVRLEDEWFQEIEQPEAVISALKQLQGLKPDLFTFCQRLPHVERRYSHHSESEAIAAIPLHDPDHWWQKQIEGATRNQVRKSTKVGVVVRECIYDDEFVRGMTAIFNEAPVRQGRPFWHYGKSFETVKQQFSRNLFRERLIGAYYQDELIGFAMLGKSRHYTDLGQIIAKIEHREKSVTTALIAKAVEISCAQNAGHLVYGFWTDDSLGQFKRRLGFQRFDLPRYFVPLTLKGELAIRTGAHRGWKTLLPPRLLSSLKHARAAWYARQDRRRATANS